MAAKITKTDRLVLRPLALGDAEQIARLIGDIDVSRWLTVVPHPYSVQDAQEFIQNGDPKYRYCIEIDGRLAGIVSTNVELGYWLGKPYWRNGYMRQAVGAALANWFDGGEGELTSGYFVGNDGSRRILESVGFKPTVLEPTVSRATGLVLPLQKMTLSRADWQARHE